MGPIRRHSLLMFSLAFVLGTSSVVAQVAPPLGVVRQFGVLGGSAVTGSAGLGTTVNGDVGSSPTPSVSSFPPSNTVAPFILHLANDAVVQQAHLDAITAYNNLFAQGTGAGVTPLGPQLSGLNLAPGVYRFAAGADLASLGTLTLTDPSGTGVYVFSAGTSLTINVGSQFLGNANPCNVYWQAGSDATLNGSNFFGTVIANQSVTVSSAANVTGRVVAVNGAVTMPGTGGNTIGGCSAAAVLPPAPSGVSCASGLITNGVGGSASVSLPSAAPAGGTIVLLTSGNTAVATVPASAVVPAGSTSVTFTMTPAGAAGSSLVTAATAGGSATCSVLVTAAPVPTLDSLGLLMLFVLLAVTGAVAAQRFTA